MTHRIHPNVVVTHPSPNKSARSAGVPLNLIVIHDTESHNVAGAADLKAIGDLFSHTSLQASAHVCTDGEGNSGRFVADRDKAWHCVQYNSAALGIEQIGFASNLDWPEAQLHETARWVALWSKRHGIPIRKAAVKDGRVMRSGVITHHALGAAGGGHWDPGYHYPMKHMLALANYYRKQL